MGIIFLKLSKMLKLEKLKDKARDRLNDVLRINPYNIEATELLKTLET